MTPDIATTGHPPVPAATPPHAGTASEGAAGPVAPAGPWTIVDLMAALEASLAVVKNRGTS